MIDKFIVLWDLFLGALVVMTMFPRALVVMTKAFYVLGSRLGSLVAVTVNFSADQKNKSWLKTCCHLFASTNEIVSRVFCVSIYNTHFSQQETNTFIYSQLKIFLKCRSATIKDWNYNRELVVHRVVSLFPCYS